VLLVVPQLWNLVTSHSMWRPWFNTTQVYVGFAAGKVALRPYFRGTLPFYECSVRINSSTTHAI